MQELYEIYEKIQIIVDSLVIKYDRRAREFETLDTRKLSDRYISAKKGIDSFSTYFKFDREAIENAGITDPELIDSYIQAKGLIPNDKRDDVVKEQRKLLIDNYQEYNNYYRTLWGLPYVQDLEDIYVDQDTATRYNISATTPVHLLSNNDIYILDMAGYITTLQETYPTKEYLKYLGVNKIDPFISRSAKDFTIIKVVNSLEMSQFTKKFLTIYEQCRSYFTEIIHVPEFSGRYDYYDNFIAMMILIMTIQRIISETFKDGISRDFFDTELIKNFFESYNIPFLEKLPYDYQIAIVKKMNQFIQYKSTDKVLFDIASILDFTDIEIVKYFLVKEHKLDEDSKPVFVYDQVDNGDGTFTPVLNKEEMYDFFFQRVSIEETNVADAMLNTTNKIDYQQITLDDPYWFEDETLKAQLLEEEFTYVESKYVGINIVYKFPKMLFEVLYFYRMMLEKRDQLDEADITLTIPKVAGATEVRIFDVIILLATLMIKKNKFTGNVFHTPSQLLSVYGFNFSEDLQSIRDYIIENEDHIDQSILDYFINMDIGSSSDINRVYGIIKDVSDFCIKRMADTDDVKQYRAYQKLFKSLMVTQENEHMFTKIDGTVASTYMDFLEDRNAQLYDFVSNLAEDEIQTYSLHIINRVMKKFDELEYLQILDSDSSIFLEALRELILFFKSYTVDLLPNNIVLLFNSRYYNMVKLMQHIQGYKTLQLSDHIRIDYADILAQVNHHMRFNLLWEFRIELLGSAIMKYRDTKYDISDLHVLHLMLQNKELINTYEKMFHSVNMSVKDEDLVSGFTRDLLSVSTFKDTSLNPLSKLIWGEIKRVLYTNIGLENKLGADNTVSNEDNMSIVDKLSKLSTYLPKEGLRILDSVFIDTIVNNQDSMFAFDVSAVSVNTVIKDNKLKMSESLRITYEFNP